VRVLLLLLAIHTQQACACAVVGNKIIPYVIPWALGKMAEVKIGTFRAELASPSVRSFCQFSFIQMLLNLPFNPSFHFLCCLHSAGVDIF
jgi:hypothetical protein